MRYTFGPYSFNQADNISIIYQKHPEDTPSITCEGSIKHILNYNILCSECYSPTILYYVVLCKDCHHMDTSPYSYFDYFVPDTHLSCIYAESHYYKYIGMYPPWSTVSKGIKNRQENTGISKDSLKFIIFKFKQKKALKRTLKNKIPEDIINIINKFV